MSTSTSDAKVSRCGAKPVEANSPPCGNDVWCLGGGRGIEILNLWAAMTAGCGRLPTADELEQQLHAAGYVNVRSRRPVPGQAYYVFTAEIAPSAR